MSNETLPQSFTGTGEVKGFEFEQITRTTKGYIYKVFAFKGSHYEVFKLNPSPVCLDFKNRIYSKTATKDSYPKANSFGVWAWTYNDINSAFEKLFSL